MEQHFSSLTSDELNVLYHKINAELTQQFLNRVPWEEQQERIEKLSKISQELSRRNTALKTRTETSSSERVRG